MINFHKSPTATFETLSMQLYDILSWHKVQNSNILYLTHEIDQIKKIVMLINNTVNLKQQALQHYETSPQTEQDEQ